MVEEIKWSEKYVVQLKDELSDRKIPIGKSNKKDMIRKLQEDDAEIKRTRPKYKLKKLSRDEQLQLDLLEEQVHDIELRKQDLIEYRSHLARHKSEDDYAKQVMENLEDDEAIVTSDYKMKLLSCFFRENQKKWFGKRGTSVLGFMICTNAKDEEKKQKGEKELVSTLILLSYNYLMSSIIYNL